MYRTIPFLVPRGQLGLNQPGGGDKLMTSVVLSTVFYKGGTNARAQVEYNSPGGSGPKKSDSSETRVSE